MYRTCIAIMDASVARFFTLDRTSDGDGLREDLVEGTDFVNPGRRLTQGEQLADARQGMGHANGVSFAYDDHRMSRQAEIDRGFARQVAAELHRLTDDMRVRHLIICASPGMLGELRQCARAYARPGLEVDEMPRDLVKLTPPQIRDRLREYGLLQAAPLRN
jgi:protein required for attachment to host cells